MKLQATNAAWLLPFLLTACFHKTGQQPARFLAPPISNLPQPTPEPVELALSVMTLPSEPLTYMTVGPMEQPKPRPPVRRQQPAIGQAADQPPAGTAASTANTQPAAGESPAVSAIGQLSSGDSVDLRKQTMDSLAAIESSLYGIDRRLSGQQQKTAAQIREYLKQARAALASGDVDGAHTLASKANLLLKELSSQVY